MDVYEKYGDTVIGLAEVEDKVLDKFGVIGGVDLDKGVYEIKEFVEVAFTEARSVKLPLVAEKLFVEKFVA